MAFLIHYASGSAELFRGRLKKLSDGLFYTEKVMVFRAK